MNDLLKLHKTVGGNGLNKLTYREYLDEHFNLGELKDVIVEDNTLKNLSIDPTCLAYYPFTENLGDMTGNTTITNDLGTLSIDTNEKALRVVNNRGLLKNLNISNLTQLTVEYMWKPTHSSYGGGLFMWGLGHSLHPLGTNGTKFGFWDGTNRIANIVPTLNEWCHQMYTYNNGENKLYHNGNLVLTWTYTKTFSNTDMQMFCHQTTTNYNQGYVKHLKVHSKVLTEPTMDNIPSYHGSGYRISPPIELPKNIVSSKIDWEGEGKINIIGLENGEIPYDIHADINDNTLIYLQGHNFKDYSNYNRELKGTNKVKFRDNAMSLNGRFLKTTTSDKTSYIKGTDFTVEFWGKCNSLPVIKWNSFFEINNETGVSVPDEFRIGLHNTTNNLIAIVGKTFHSYATPLPLNEWHHYCLTRQGSTVYGFIDGVLKFQDSNSSSLTGNTLYLGHNAYSTDQHLDCDIKEFMVSDVCKYTSNFTPKHNSFNISEGYLIPCENGKAITSKLPKDILLAQTIKDTEYISNVNLSIKHSKVHDVMTPTLLAEQGDSKELYLYKPGDECTSLTGGWGITNSSYNVNTPTYERTDRLRAHIVCGNSNGHHCGFITNKAIDLTGYSKIYFDMSNYHTDEFDRGLINIKSGSSSVASIGSPAYENAPRQIREIDISNINTSCIIQITAETVWNGKQAEVVIYNIWLEK